MTRIADVIGSFGLVAGVSLALLGGCESGSGTVRPAPGVAVTEGGDASAVAVFESDPASRFEVVGLVSASADARFEGRIDSARSAAEREIRRQAAAVGADAVVIDEAFVAQIEGVGVAADGYGSGFGSGFGAGEGNLQRPGGSAVVTRPVHRVVLRGRAIRRSDQP